MKATLKVKNFGPIKHAELDLRNVNVFIGPQASGKSTLAKLYSICSSPLKYFDEDIFDEFETQENIDKRIATKFSNELEKLNIKSFINAKSFFEFETEIHKVTLSEGGVKLERKITAEIINFGKLIEKKLIDEANVFVKKYYKKLMSFQIHVVIVKFESKHKNRDSKMINSLIEFNRKFVIDEESFTINELYSIYQGLLNIEKKLLLGTIYVPAERVIVPILKGAALNLQNNDVPIPKHILSFAAEYERSLKDLKEFDLSFLKEGYSFKSINGEDRFFYNKTESILLSESATGIQSLIPLLLPIFSFKDELPHAPAYIIEEPEMNLYPKAQYDLIKFLESKRIEGGLLDNAYSHLYTTHSPYILSSFNNMLYAHKKSILAENDKLKLKEIEEVMPKENWLNPDNFNAYTIIDGTAIQIFDRENGLIDDNVIDEVTDEMNNDFDQLLEL